MIDYKDLLAKYLDHIGQTFGDLALGEMIVKGGKVPAPDFTDEEMAALNECADIKYRQRIDPSGRAVFRDSE